MASLVPFLVLGSAFLVSGNAPFAPGNIIEDAFFWAERGSEALTEALRRSQLPREHRAKNVIFFVGDGMGSSVLTAARIYRGQMAGKTGEEGSLAFESFPYLSLVKTYSVDHQVPDSASTATAMFTGVKTRSSFLGLDATADADDCTSRSRVPSLLQWAQDEGKYTVGQSEDDRAPIGLVAPSWNSPPFGPRVDCTTSRLGRICRVLRSNRKNRVSARANPSALGAESTSNSPRPDSRQPQNKPHLSPTGLVTTTRVTHATPAALYAHVPNRNWECDTKIPREVHDSVAGGECKDIARQLVEERPGQNLRVCRVAIVGALLGRRVVGSVVIEVMSAVIR
ncbi:unnamed protein product [Darwinula stevensoni]|uniref:Alkaline phosphatase n=1 Tax=Darwinula stevensoni TaxID=69355 RepID=A0A7R9A3V1_9CRUS|nr:unnamed protein product [Darwinula stevensoni]CAG0882919.1 unnamed protein product [Darwinula stevensoni]